GEIEEAVKRLSGRRDFELYGAGRTDAGVHALAQVAHLDLNTALDPERLCFALNDELPADIHVLAAERVARRFHARHDAVRRSYLYQVSRRRTALGKPFVWWVKDALDAQRMREAARVFSGLHDFRSFADARAGETETRVKLEEVACVEAGPLILLRVAGSHFLWKMVRRMVGVLVEVGRGGLAPGQVARMLEQASEVPAQLTAPPSGLFLESVSYAVETGERPLHPVLNL
ncbi:MAG TPA: tRNA pseudouridine(38-40) synthase TruA, partial [Vicinamibacteria bacterium]